MTTSLDLPEQLKNCLAFQFIALGKPLDAKIDDFLETALDPPYFWKILLQIFGDTEGTTSPRCSTSNAVSRRALFYSLSSAAKKATFVDHFRTENEEQHNIDKNQGQKKLLVLLMQAKTMASFFI